MIQTSDTHPSGLAKHAARLGPNHGYRIEGDLARLHADVSVETDLDLPHAHWALQLWACDAPFDGGSLSGVKVAEAALALPEHRAEPQRLDAEAHASLPIGQRDYSMVLVLASGAPGAFDQIHDFANYPERERFVTPHLEGSVGYQIDGDEILLRAERVLNPRSADNLSGSLALELWALSEPYDGTHTFRGTLLANADLGRIAGGNAVYGFERRVHFTAPPEGSWNIVLMLREWAIGGHVTRDYCTFSQPYVVNATPADVSATLIIPAVSSSNIAPSLNLPRRREPVVVRWKPDYERDVSATTPGGVRSPLWSEERVSIMHASVEELAAVQGLTRKLAQAIVKNRPFESLDDLVRIRGIGPKMLVKLRSSLTL